MINYYAYDIVTGKITQHFSYPSLLSEDYFAAEGLKVKQGSPNPSDYYVLEGDLTPRPSMPIIVSSSNIETEEITTFSGIPLGTLVNCATGKIEFNDDQDLTLDWSSSVAGIFNFRFLNFPYKELNLSVVVE